MFARRPHLACALLLVLAGVLNTALEAAQVACPSQPTETMGVLLEHAPAALGAAPVAGQTHELVARMGEVQPELAPPRLAAPTGLRRPPTLHTLCVCLLV